MGTPHPRKGQAVSAIPWAHPQEGQAKSGMPWAHQTQGRDRLYEQSTCGGETGPSTYLHQISPGTDSIGSHQELTSEASPETDS